MKAIHISDTDKRTLETVLTGPYEVYVFGSRLKGTHRPFSDLDICLKGTEKLSASTIGMLREELSQSDIPYKIDLVDYYHLADSFKQLIDNEAVRLSATTPAAV